MVERFKAHAWKACEVNSLRRFKSCSLRQTKACNGKPFSMLREQDNEMTYRFATVVFCNGVATLPRGFATGQILFSPPKKP